MFSEERVAHFDDDDGVCERPLPLAPRAVSPVRGPARRRDLGGPFARGARNSLFRGGDAEPAPTPIDEAYRVGVEPWDSNWELSAGSRLGVVIASDDDYVRHDPTDRSTNELVLGESALRFEGVAEGVDAPSSPDASLSATIDSETYTGGQTAQWT